jgi:hypothetical protein
MPAHARPLASAIFAGAILAATHALAGMTGLDGTGIIVGGLLYAAIRNRVFP